MVWKADSLQAAIRKIQISIKLHKSWHTDHGPWGSTCVAHVTANQIVVLWTPFNPRTAVAKPLGSSPGHLGFDFLWRCAAYRLPVIDRKVTPHYKC